MAVEILLPALSAGMEDAIVARWLVAEGDRVEPGQALAEIETDKATMELEASEDGIVGRLSVAEGARADVGAVVAVLLAQGERLPQADAAAIPSPLAAVQPAVPLLEESRPAATPPEERQRVSPIARRLAAEAGLSLAGRTGSGPKGRIVRFDVERLIDAMRRHPDDAPAACASAAPAEFPEAAQRPAGIGPHELRPISNMRSVIARRLTEAKQRIPHFYLSADCELDRLMALRVDLNEGRDRESRISVNDMVVKAAAHALRRVPAANAVWTEDGILELMDVDISVAVATDGGLITPILRGADRMSLGALSSEMKGLAARAREGRLGAEEYQGGGFTVSNLGMYGVKSFCAIVNPPQSCILAVGAAERRPVGRGDQILLAQVMTLTLSVDHRSVDGATGAQLLAAIKEGIEAPFSILT